MWMILKYISFSLKRASSAISIIESCIKDVFSWLVANKLSANPNKTEYLLFNSKNINLQVVNINLDPDIISSIYCAKNLVVLFQSDMSFDNHISSILKSCFVQLRDFCHIRPLLSKTAAITLANSFKHSHPDYCNSLVYGLLNYSIHHVQKVQNTATRIVTRSFRSSHIITVLKSLHWLTVNYGINFKICCITHRALFLHEPHYLSSLFSLRSHSLHSSSFSPLLLSYFNKNSYGFCSFYLLHFISGITYLIIFALHQPICRLEKM